MWNPISQAHKKAKKENRAAPSTNTVAGESSKKQSLEIENAIPKKAEILELGGPHNTPVAEGSQIQTRAQRAIKNGNRMNENQKTGKDFKKSNKKKPNIMMGNFKMIFQYGEKKF
jgi:Tryptophan synthase alpha chain